MNNDFLSRVRRFGNEIIAESTQEWQKSLFTVTNVLFYFSHAILCDEHTNPLRTTIERSFRHCCKGRPFLTEYCDVITIDLWRHANAKYWYYDVIFVDCHCTRKLTPRRSALVNNSREFRYLATRSRRHRAAYVESQIVLLFPQSLTIRVVGSVLNDARRRYEKCIVLGQ